MAAARVRERGMARASGAGRWARGGGRRLSAERGTARFDGMLRLLDRMLGLIGATRPRGIEELALL